MAGLLPLDTGCSQPPTIIRIYFRVPGGAFANPHPTEIDLPPLAIAAFPIFYMGLPPLDLCLPPLEICCYEFVPS